jgi:hypothetical protein
MRKLLPHIAIALSGSFLLTACQSSNARSREVQLLTGTPWKYEQAGFSTEEKDADEDETWSSFNALDPRINGQDKDNLVIFQPDGTGYDNRLPFTWSLQNNDSIIYFQDQYYKVKTLTRKKLVLSAEDKLGNAETHYTIVLKH